MFGEAGVVDAAQRTATLIATSPSHMLVLLKKNFRKFLEAVPDFKVTCLYESDCRTHISCKQRHGGAHMAVEL